MKKVLICTIILFAIEATAQDSTKHQNTPLSFGGYAETYYSYDFNKPDDNNRPFFLYSHNRHNEFNINLAYLKGSYTAENIRANIALAVGSYMNANYAAEPGVLKNIYEANAGLKLSKKKDLWLDIGIIPSHIGFESARSYDCWTLTRSLAAETSPYFESGARLSYNSDNGKLSLAALALNGWQRITRVEGNSLMSWGMQATVKPSGKIMLNYSNFLGTDKPDSARLWRIFHDVYAVFQFSDKIGLTAGFDIGTEQESKGSSTYNSWFTPVGILRFTPNTKWSIALRGEYVSDENGVIISTGTPNGFKTFGASLNVDRKIGSAFMWRTEIRSLNSKDPVFTRNDDVVKNNTAVTTSFALSF